MKLFKTLKNVFSDSDILLWVYPVLLIVPNILLDITELYSPVSKAANLLLPLGIYYLIISACRRTGITGLVMFIFAFFAAFQIVLLNLYGEGIIAIDMFLNVATTNVSEATELLGSLLIAIAIICILYIPPIIASIVQTASQSLASAKAVKRARITGAVLALCGVLCAVASCVYIPDYKLKRELFPVNVMDNLCTAVKRTIATQKYEQTSSDFRFNATSTHDKELKEVYVLMVGETSRAENWQLTGYSRPTNPRLSKRTNLVYFPLALSESNTTHKSVPMILSHLDSHNYGDSIYYTKSISEAFNEAGFHTAFISNQRRNHSFIDFFGGQAHTTEFIIDEFDSPQHDLELVGRMKRAIDNANSSKVMIVLHAYGSHFNYKERYPKEEARFLPDNNTEAAAFNRSQLLNAYDNSIAYTDLVLDSIVSTLQSYRCPAALVYLSDHGEDIFDDSRERFLHASPAGTYHQLHVPFIVWTSNEYRSMFPEKVNAMIDNKGKNISSSASAFHTTADLAGISTYVLNPSASVADTAYTEPQRLFLNDYLEGVPLRKSGLRKPDFEMLDKRGFKY